MKTTIMHRILCLLHWFEGVFGYKVWLSDLIMWLTTAIYWPKGSENDDCNCVECQRRAEEEFYNAHC